MLGFFYFILNSGPLIRDVACSRLYLDGKNMRRECQMNTLMVAKSYLLNTVWLFLTFVPGKIFRKDYFVYWIGENKVLCDE